MKARHALLGLAATASAAAALWVPPEQAPVVQPVARAPARSVPADRPRAAEADTSLASLAPRFAPPEDTATVFGVPEWSRPKPAAKAAAGVPARDDAAPPAPQAPPAPFRVIGRWDDGGQAGVFIEHQQKALAARVGDNLTPEWKVESIEGARLVLQYLPLAQRQTLDWGTP